MQHMLVQMILQHLSGQPCQGTANGSKELQDFPTRPLSLQRTLHGLHLAFEATDAGKELSLLSNGMGHRGLYII
jgi:hypothetical protein